MDKHPTLQELDALVRGALSPAPPALRAHLAACRSCQRMYEDCIANLQMAEELRAATSGDMARPACVSAPASVPVWPDPQNAGNTTASRTMPADSPPEDRLGCGSIEGYRLIREIHRGGQGVVYEAWQEAARRRVAVKLLLGGPFAGEHAKRRFEREIELSASLRHPNIVAIHDSGITRGDFYLAMDFVDGAPLTDYLARHTLPVRQKMALFGRVCAAVSYAHQHGVIHRDLKPSNILVDESGEPYVLDFGLAKRVTKMDVSLSLDGQVLGTPRYMSPEQARGAIHELDVRTDVYSLGLILYEMLTGALPYPQECGLTEMLHNILEREPPPPSRTVQSLDSDVNVIVLKALAKEPPRRYQSAAELGHDVQCWLDGLPIVARSTSSGYLLRKLVARHRYASMVAGFILVSILAFSYISFQFYLGAEAARRRAETVTRQMTAQAADNLAFAQQVTFSFFLQAFQETRASEARLMAGFLPETSREGLAARFLLDSRPLPDKLVEFQQRMPPADRAFARYAIAEPLLHDGNRPQAAEAFGQLAGLLRAERSVANRWLALRVAARLKELGTDVTGQAADPLEAREP